MVDLKAIGKRIKHYRECERLTQSALAERLEVSASYISQVERGIAVVSLKRLDEISEYVGTTLQALVADVDVNRKDYLVSEIAEKIDPLPPRDRKRLLAMIDAYIIS